MATVREGSTGQRVTFVDGQCPSREQRAYEEEEDYLLLLPGPKDMATVREGSTGQRVTRGWPVTLEGATGRKKKEKICSIRMDFSDKNHLTGRFTLVQPEMS